MLDGQPEGPQTQSLAGQDSSPEIAEPHMFVLVHHPHLSVPAHEAQSAKLQFGFAGQLDGLHVQLLAGQLAKSDALPHLFVTPHHPQRSVAAHRRQSSKLQFGVAGH